jgi:hypothetical protein
MSKLILSYEDQAARIAVLERAMIASEQDVKRLKGEAESWEKVFDRTCQLLADAKSELEKNT